MLGAILAAALLGLVVLATREPEEEFPDMPPEPEDEPEAEPFEPFAPLAALVLDFEDLMDGEHPGVALERGDELLVRLPSSPERAEWLFESDSPELVVEPHRRPYDMADYIRIAPRFDARPTEAMVYIQQEKTGTEGLSWIELEGLVDVEVIASSVPAAGLRFA